MEETELYFAFGSNLSARKMRERGTRFISREGAVLQGFRVVFSIWKDDGFGYANIIPDKESTVYGALYICFKGSLAKLDEHEAGRLRRVIVQVERKSGEIVDAIAYQAYEEYVKKGLKLSQIYLNEILEGEEDLIPKEYADYFRNFLCEKTEK